jgi:hypothetical protein
MEIRVILYIKILKNSLILDLNLQGLVKKPLILTNSASLRGETGMPLLKRLPKNAALKQI